MSRKIQVTVWNENRHEQLNEEVRKVYPNGIHEALAAPLRESGMDVRTATLEQPEHGLSQEVLDQTDVLIWWGHIAHDQVSEEIVERVHQRVLGGMGLIVLHSGHFSKIFKRLMGTGCDLKWREADEKERLWVVNPSHPIVEGLGQYIELEREEMYGEFFDIPEPEELILVSWFEGGEVFRSGCTFTRGQGKIFYFRPGHETYPTYHQSDIQKIIVNGVRWASPTNGPKPVYGNHPPIENIKAKS
ncbi:ThuA domain-containing protein [Ammoniphilus sp. CFH 90114]|uniref:ThuA domain-containing protein n=1 Tax=Ammoniphilus sp. CFH 90114 TaxID=2493665 RepID=UPI00100FAB8C|nr:ThuA domain-containing protein [Ammoniphilus sp. CFH 90114]RXT15363.1 trehalose utilization protein ThuA [Ammoniphilus sp. CFH 90114]